MTMWLLDDGPFGLLARIPNPEWVWPPSTIHVVEKLAEDVALDRSGRRQRLLDMGEPEARAVTVHPVLADSAAGEMLFTHLRPRRSETTKDLAEDQAIALCATALPTAVFVTMDRAAAFIALAELGVGRVSTPFDVWEELAGRGLITCEQRQELMVMCFKGDSGLPGMPRRFRRQPPSGD